MSEENKENAPNNTPVDMTSEWLAEELASIEAEREQQEIEARVRSEVEAAETANALEAANEPEPIKNLKQIAARNSGLIVDEREQAELEKARAAQIEDARFHNKTSANLQKQRDKAESNRHSLDRK